MRALVVYCHPRPESFTAAVRDVVLEKLNTAGAEVRLIDLYDRNFDPILCADQHCNYEDLESDRSAIAPDIADVAWCDTLIFVYPTWWYGMPAMLKGWLDRVLLPGVAFTMPSKDGEGIGRGLTHITQLGVFTTCGASWWITRIIGAPGKRTLLRGVRFLCAKTCRTTFAAHYLMDSSTPESRARHLEKVAKRVNRMTRSIKRARTTVEAPA